MSDLTPHRGLPAKHNRGLTRGERRVYDLLIRSGWSNRLIADELGISVGTVKIYMSHVMKEYQANSRDELIANALWAKIRLLELDIRELKERAD